MYIFYQIWKVFNNYFIKYYFFSLFSPSGTSIIHMLVCWWYLTALIIFFILFSFWVFKVANLNWCIFKFTDSVCLLKCATKTCQWIFPFSYYIFSSRISIWILFIIVGYPFFDISLWWDSFFLVVFSVLNTTSLALWAPLKSFFYNSWASSGAVFINYCWLLNNLDLNCEGPLMWLFCNSKYQYYSPSWFVVESTDGIKKKITEMEKWVKLYGN